ncbi:hypothetical protein LX36DRAFT_749525 [Colletotrichum falcatum]|nr:hypothetical protein LX36DRAFT_749525 [Colletotrichum falcatum]
MATKKKKQTSKTHGPVAIADIPDDGFGIDIADTFDDGPEVSPYRSPTCRVYFGNGEVFKAPRDIICVSAKLSSICSSSHEILVEDVPAEAGHVLLHYLHTGTWQTLCRGYPIRGSRTSTYFETSLYVYAAARTYGLAGLAELAKENIPRYAEGLSALDIIVLAAKPCENLPEDDPWFLPFIKAQMEQLFEDSASVDQSVFLDCFNGSANYSRILVKSMALMCCEKLASFRLAEAQAVPLVAVKDVPHPVTLRSWI